MSRFAVTVDGPQAGKFREVLGTAKVPVCAPIPRWISAGDQEVYGYQADLRHLTTEQIQQLGGNLLIPAGDAWSWGDLAALEACTRRIQAAAEAERQSRYIRPRQPASSLWVVVEPEPEPEPQHTELAVITHPDSELIDHRLIDGLRRAVTAADARTQTATMCMQMAEARAEAMAAGQIPALLVAWIVGILTAVLVVLAV